MPRWRRRSLALLESLLKGGLSHDCWLLTISELKRSSVVALDPFFRRRQFHCARNRTDSPLAPTGDLRQRNLRWWGSGYQAEGGAAEASSGSPSRLAG